MTPFYILVAIVFSTAVIACLIVDYIDRHEADRKAQEFRRAVDQTLNIVK